MFLSCPAALFLAIVVVGAKRVKRPSSWSSLSSFPLQTYVDLGVGTCELADGRYPSSEVAELSVPFFIGRRATECKWRCTQKSACLGFIYKQDSGLSQCRHVLEGPLKLRKLKNWPNYTSHCVVKSEHVVGSLPDITEFLNDTAATPMAAGISEDAPDADCVGGSHTGGNNASLLHDVAHFIGGSVSDQEDSSHAGSLLDLADFAEPTSADNSDVEPLPDIADFLGDVESAEGESIGVAAHAAEAASSQELAGHYVPLRQKDAKSACWGLRPGLLAIFAAGWLMAVA